jgi:N-methylhydantoinase A
VPRASPAFSALGALAAAPSLDEERSLLAPAHRADPARLRALWGELEERARRFLGSAGFPIAAIAHRYQLNLRYPGQNWALAVDVAERRGDGAALQPDAALRDRAVAAFHRRHEEEYGHARLGEEPEITGLRLLSSVETPKPAFGAAGAAAARPARAGRTRRANLGRGFAETPVYRGEELGPGSRVPGPGIVEETYTTIVVYPGWDARVDAAGDYALSRLG